MEKKNRKDKVPTKVHQVRGRYQELVRSWNIYKEKHFGHTDAAIYWIFTIIISTVAAISCADNGLPVWLGFLVGFVVVFALLSIGYVIAAWIVKRMLSRGIKVLLYIASMLIVVEYLLEIGSFNKFSDLQLVGMTAGIVLVLYLFARSIGAMIKNHVYTKTTVLTCVITGAGILIGTVFLCAGGYQDTYVNQYLALNQELKEEYASVDLTGFNEDISAGSYTVKTLLYGMDSEDDLVSDVVDMTRYVGSSDGIRQMYRTWHQGYTLDEVPMAGKIYYPEEVDNCPVLFLIHGNHNFVTESYLGYDYLGEYLASNGYVVVSVDENSMNSSVFDSLSGENDGRAILLLENMKQVQEYNDDVNNVLYQKMNYEEIALAGHSRGGEAVSIAALFNEYDCYPENGNIKFNYHFQIKSVIAIAPTVDQYEPADHATALEDVNYLLIQGANDQDVSVFMGAKTYNQVSFSGEGEYLKSYLYIAG